MRNVLAILALAAVTPASAEIFGPGPGGAITMGGNNGHSSWSGGGGSSIILDRPGEVVTSFDSVTVFGLQHTWVGTLEIWLNHLPSNSWAGLHSGTGSEGANLNGTYTFRVDSSLPTLTDVADGLGDSQTVPQGDYALFKFANEDPTRDDFSDMIGENLSGEWRLVIVNHSQMDAGSFGGWSFSATAAPVPEPATMAVLGLGLFAVTRRRQSR